MKKLKRLVTIILTFCMMLLFSGIVKAENIITVPVTVKENYTEASAFISHLNNQRTSTGKDAYIADSKLIEIAMQRATETCVYWSHCSPSEPKNSGLVPHIRGSALYDSIIGENIAVGVADAPSVYTVWYNSDSGHKGLLVDTKYYKYCGAGCVEYDNKTYWVLIVSDIPGGDIVTTLPSGVKTKTRSVQVAASLLDTLSKPGARCYYGQTDNWGIYCRNKGDLKSGVAYGYKVEDPSLLSIKCNNPEIFTVDSLCNIKTTGTGTGTMSVSVAGNAPTTISVLVEPQHTGLSVEGKSIDIILPAKNYSYTGNPITPKPVITDCFGNTLTEGIHYTLSYKNNVNPSNSAEVIVTFIHEGYSNWDSVTFAITGTTHGSVGGNDKPSSGSTSNGGSSGTSGGNGSSSSSSNGTGTSSGLDTSSGGNTNTAKAKTFTKVKLKKSSYVYNGKSCKPGVTVYMGKKKLAAKYYTVKYTQNKNVGIAAVTVTGKGAYKGYKSVTTFKITLPKVSLSSVKSSKKATVSIKRKKSTQSSGYEIQYSTNKKFRSAVSSVKVSGTKKTGGTLKGLQSKKTYYVRIRSYKKVSGTYWYSAWSSAKKVKVK